LTTALYYTPSGRSIQGHGINPDRIVAVPKEQQVANAVIHLRERSVWRAQATGALAPKDVPVNPTAAKSITGEADHPINPKVIGTAQDAQLRAALDLLGTHAPRRGKFSADPSDQRREELAQAPATIWRARGHFEEWPSSLSSSK